MSDIRIIKLNENINMWHDPHDNTVTYTIDILLPFSKLYVGKRLRSVITYEAFKTIKAYRIKNLYIFYNNANNVLKMSYNNGLWYMNDDEWYNSCRNELSNLFNEYEKQYLVDLKF